MFIDPTLHPWDFRHCGFRGCHRAIYLGMPHFYCRNCHEYYCCVTHVGSDGYQWETDVQDGKVVCGPCAIAEEEERLRIRVGSDRLSVSL